MKKRSLGNEEAHLSTENMRDIDWDEKKEQSKSNVMIVFILLLGVLFGLLTNILCSSKKILFYISSFYFGEMIVFFAISYLCFISEFAQQSLKMISLFFGSVGAASYFFLFLFQMDAVQ